VPMTSVSPAMSADDTHVLSTALSKTTIQNRRLTYLNRTTYLSTPSTQQRLFPHLYKTLIERHESASQKLEALNISKARSLTHVLLDASDHMQALQKQKERTDEQRREDEERVQREVDIAERIPREVLRDRDRSREFLERLMRERFLRGEDQDFEYEAVDAGEEWDDWETLEEDIRSKYFDEETPEEVQLEGEEGEGVKGLTGQTGVQDF